MHEWCFKKTEKSLNRPWSCYLFLVLGAMILICMCSLNSQQANGISIVAWITLEIGFQYWTFKQKFKFCSFDMAQLGVLLALGFDQYMYGIRLGLEIGSKNPWIDEKNIWFLSHDFPIFFKHLWYKSCLIPLILSIFS